MEQKAKRIGKWNIVDIIAVILIVAVVAFAAWKLLGPNDSISAEREMTKVTYVVKVEGVPAELYDNCVAHLPSPLMASGALVGGEIVAVEQEPYYVLDAGGNWVEDTAHTTLLFTVETETPTRAPEAISGEGRWAWQFSYSSAGTPSARTVKVTLVISRWTPSPLPRSSSLRPTKASTARIRITAMISMMLNFPTRFAFCSMASSITGADAPGFFQGSTE